MAYRNRKRRSRVNWGFVVVVSALAAAAVLITLSEPLGLENVPTWEQVLAEPEHASTPEREDSAPDGETGQEPSEAEVQGVSVHILDVGQGDSILIRTPESDVLIDAGPVDAQQDVLAYLRKQGVEELDLVIATHPHADHIGGMAEVVKRWPVEQIIAPEVPESADATSYSYEKLLTAVAVKGLRLTRPGPDDVYELGGATLTILGPVELDLKNNNNNSVVARLDCGETSFLFTGDCEAEEEESLLAAGADLEADVLKTGHHGSKTSTTQEFLDAVHPRFAAISCGWDNSYGHPNSEVLRRLERMGVSVWRTDIDGAIVFTSDGERVTVAQGAEDAAA